MQEALTGRKKTADPFASARHVVRREGRACQDVILALRLVHEHVVSAAHGSIFS